MILVRVFFFFLLFSALPASASTAASPTDDPHETDSLRIKIVAFGNSITATRKTIDRVFAQRLPELLKQNGLASEIINSGIPGSHTGRQTDHDLFKIRHGLERFKSDVLAHQPDLVTIGFGTNDAHIDSKVKGGPSRIPLSKYRENLEYMISKLQENHIRVVLIAPNILGAKYGKLQNDRLLKYVKVVRKLSKKHETGLVDNYKLFKEYEKKSGNTFEELMLDGVHPNDAGHRLIAEKLVTEIVKTMKIKKNV